MQHFSSVNDVLKELRNFSHRDSRFALGLIDQALTIWPTALLLRSARIQYLTQSGYAQEAAQAADALDSDAEVRSPSILHNMAMAYLADHRHVDAVTTARRALAMPGNKRPVVYIEMSEVLMKNSLNEEALQAAQQGMQHYPEQPLLRNMTLQLLGELGHKDQALELIEQTLATHPHHQMLRNAVTLAFNGLGLREQALANAEKTTYDFPYDDNAQGNLIKLLIAQGDLKAAERTAEAAVRNTPNNDHRHAMLAMAALSNGNMKRAVQQLDNLRQYSRFHTLHEAVEGELQFRSGVLPKAEYLLASSQHYGIRAFDCILWQACNNQSGQDNSAMQRRIPPTAQFLIQQEAAALTHTLNQGSDRQKAVTQLRQRLLRQSLHFSRIPGQLPPL